MNVYRQDELLINSVVARLTEPMSFDDICESFEMPQHGQRYIDINKRNHRVELGRILPLMQGLGLAHYEVGSKLWSLTGNEVF